MTETCKERVKGELADRIQDIRKIWKLYQRDPDASDEDLGCFPEYGLCFDCVARGTFANQKRGYFLWQLSWGGPSDEFHFYTDETFEPVEIEYWFLDWFDVAKVDLSGQNYELLAEIFAYFKEGGSVKAEFEKAR